MVSEAISPPPNDIAPGQHLIDGVNQSSLSGKTFSVTYPPTGGTLTTCAEGDAQDIDLAVAAARKAFEGPWSKMSPGERGERLKKLGRLMEDHAEELARLTTLEMGKPIRESRMVDIPHSASVFRYYGEWVDKHYGETCPVGPGMLNYTLREPLGVVGAITPWNFPLVLAAWKIAPALAMGNTVVLKPAEQSPLTSIRLGQLAMEAGLPNGVFNVVTGFGPTAGAALAGHPDVDKVAFTGETATARKIVEASGVNIKKVSLECGGKSPHIVFADADIDHAINAVFGGIFFNQGEVCNAGSRLFLPKSIAEAFLERLVDKAKSIRVGDPVNDKTEMGPLVSKDQKQRVEQYIELGVAEGARVLTGATPSPLAQSGGYFVTPTIFSNVQTQMKIANEEIFGPVLSVLHFDTEEELLRAANDTIYGLAAGVWTRDISRAHRVARALQAGTVWVNCFGVFDLSSPFGGYKQSGIGKELGKHALDLYCQTKSVWVQL